MTLERRADVSWLRLSFVPSSPCSTGGPADRQCTETGGTIEPHLRQDKPCAETKCSREPSRPGLTRAPIAARQAAHINVLHACSGPPVEPEEDDNGRDRPGSRSQPYTYAVEPRHGVVGLQTVLAAILVFGVPFFLYYRLVLFHFYIRGGFLLDTGLLASLMWHSPLAMPVPMALGGQSFYATHVSPILSVVSAISELLPVSMPHLFAGFTGVSHGLLGLAMLWLLVEGHGMRRGRHLVLAMLASCAFAFNGLALAVARYPHFEIFGAACLLLFFIALTLERRAIAIVCFILALATREDFGLHAFGFLTMWLAAGWLRGVRRTVSLAAFAAAALIYSVAALLLQHWAFPDQSSFVRIYLGVPPLAHLSWGIVTLRGFGWMMLHSAILLPAIATLVWAERTRDPFIIAGYAACVPWALLHLLAVSDLAGWMVGYYAFPFIIAMAWPFLAGATRSKPIPSLQPAVRVLGLVALSLLPIGHDYDPGHIALPEAFLHAPSARQQRLTDDAIAAVVAARPVLGRLVVDNSIAALAPLAFAHQEIAGWEEAPADTVVFLADGFDAARLLAAPGLTLRYAVPGTEVRIMTNRPEAMSRTTGIVR
jgi:hypothetical protein